VFLRGYRRYFSTRALPLYILWGSGTVLALKQWIRRRKVSKLPVDPNDPTLRCPAKDDEDDGEGDGAEGLIDEGLVASAEACCKTWEGYFETDARRASAAESMRAVSAIYFHCAGLGDIKRSEANVQFDVVVGISSSYQLFMLLVGRCLRCLARAGGRLAST
jgi:hypothetical protein